MNKSKEKIIKELKNWEDEKGFNMWGTTKKKAEKMVKQCITELSLKETKIKICDGVYFLSQKAKSSLLKNHDFKSSDNVKFVCKKCGLIVLINNL